MQALARVHSHVQPVALGRERALPARVVAAGRVVGEVQIEHEFAGRRCRGRRPSRCRAGSGRRRSCPFRRSPSRSGTKIPPPYCASHHTSRLAPSSSTRPMRSSPMVPSDDVGTSRCACGSAATAQSPDRRGHTASTATRSPAADPRRAAATARCVRNNSSRPARQSCVPGDGIRRRPHVGVEPRDPAPPVDEFECLVRCDHVSIIMVACSTM